MTAAGTREEGRTAQEPMQLKAQEHYLMFSRWPNAFNYLGKQEPRCDNVISGTCDICFIPHVPLTCPAVILEWQSEDLLHLTSHICHWLVNHLGHQSCKNLTLIQASEMVFSYLMADFITSKTRTIQSLSLFSWFPEELQTAKQETLFLLLPEEDLIRSEFLVINHRFWSMSQLIMQNIEKLAP